MECMLKLNENRVCKYCEDPFDSEVKMYRSLRFGHWICQECFHHIRGKGEIP